MYGQRLVWRIYPMYLFVTLAILAGVYLMALFTLRDFETNQTLESLRQKAILIGDEIEQTGDLSKPASVDAICKNLGKRTATRITVVLPDGKVIGDSEMDPAGMENHLGRPEVKQALSGEPRHSTRYSETLRQSLIYLGHPVKENGRVVAVIRTSVPLTAVDEALNSLYARIGLAVIVAILLVALTSYLVSRSISRPLEEMRAGAQRMAAGDFDLRLPEHGTRELGGLAESMNAMAVQLRERIRVIEEQRKEMESDIARIRHLENVRREFVANVSHELKTPITSIKGFIETLRDGAAEKKEDRERFLDIVARQADRLNSIINDILTLSMLEHDAEKSTVLLDDGKVLPVLRGAIEVCSERAGKRNVALRLQCDNSLKAKMNPALLEQAVINLVDNAVKYSGEGTTVDIAARREGGEVAIEVVDQGLGIEQEHLPRLFERFYRVDKGRSRQLGGTGLGLAIVKHVALAHGGRVDVSSVPGKGSKFSVRIPAA